MMDDKEVTTRALSREKKCETKDGRIRYNRGVNDDCALFEKQNAFLWAH
jgi:hypothetical protein